jgi:hypothetical protein
MRSGCLPCPRLRLCCLEFSQSLEKRNMIIMVGDGMSIPLSPQPGYWRGTTALCDRPISPTHHQPPNGVDLGLGAGACLV